MLIEGPAFYPPYLGEAKKWTVFVVNGSLESADLNLELLRRSQVVAVDGGLNFLEQLQVAPSLIVGDMDSMGPGVMEKYPSVPLIQLPKEKDETDLEAALKAAEGEDRVILGGLGGRPDHLMGNLSLLVQTPGRLRMEWREGLVFGITPPCGKVKVRTRPGQVISVYPAGSTAKGLYSKGLRWELTGMELDSAHYSQSNEALGEEVEIGLEEGDLFFYLNS